MPSRADRQGQFGKDHPKIRMRVVKIFDTSLDWMQLRDMKGALLIIVGLRWRHNILSRRNGSMEYSE